MADEAVMDAAVETPLETGTEVEESGEQSTGLETPESTEIPQDAAVESEKPLIDGGKLSADAKKYLDELKATNPALATALSKQLFKAAQLEKDLGPGGIKEVRELRQTLESLGGTHGVQEMQAEVQGFRTFDEQYTAADPKAIDFMTSDPAGQDAFVKLMPAALQKYEALHPEGFQNYMAQVIFGTVGSYGIPLALERLGDFIADNPKAVEQWQKIAGFVGKMSELASKRVEMPKRETAPDNRAGDLEQREQALTRNEWKNETAGEQRQVFESEWARLANGRKLSDTQTAAVKELFEIRLNKAINGKHAETLQRYFSARDKNGFLRYASTISKTEVPKALREAFDAVMPGRPGPRPGAAPAPKNGAPPARGVPIAQGFVQVAKQPMTAEIDMRSPFNTTANFQAGKAVLKDGRRVQWTRA